MSRQRRGRGLTPAEHEVWARVARTVKPLDRRTEDPNRASEPSSEPSRDSAAPQETVSRAALAHWLDTPLSALPDEREPARRENEKRVRRGRIEVEARIDLHGHTEASGRRALLGFLQRSRGRRLKSVLVITGKGASSRALEDRRFEPWDPEGPRLPGVLKRAFPRWMGEPDFAALVSGYAPAHARHGGAGAYYVMLRRAG